MPEIIKLKYKTKNNEIIESWFIKDYLGYKPIIIIEGRLDINSIEIISEERYNDLKQN